MGAITIFSPSVVLVGLQCIFGEYLEFGRLVDKGVFTRELFDWL